MSSFLSKFTPKAGIWFAFWAIGLMVLALLPTGNATSMDRTDVVYSPTSTLSVVADPESDHVAHVRRWRAVVTPEKF